MSATAARPAATPAREAAVDRLDLAVRGEPLAIEFARVGVAASTLPPVVFLHEGLGSVSMWRAFAARFCAANGLAGFLYSRLGYGGSTTRPRRRPWGAAFMHEEACEVLPALLVAAGIERPWLFGHSDGGSIALLHAARFPVAGLVVLAPHVFVEQVSLDSIAAARDAYESGLLRERLARHHADPDATFFGWSEVWLSPELRAWNIEAELAQIEGPVLAIQGERDEYGSLAHLDSIERRLPKTRLLVLPDCGHSPHRDAADTVIREAGRFILEHSADPERSPRCALPPPLP